MNSESIAHESALLAALPATSKTLENVCQLPQSTISKMLAKLILCGKVYQSDWQKPDGVCASMVYDRGPMPNNFKLPSKPHSPKTRVKPPKLPKPPPKPPSVQKERVTPLVPCVTLWDADSATDHLFNPARGLRTIPRPHPLMSMYGGTFAYKVSVDESK